MGKLPRATKPKVVMPWDDVVLTPSQAASVKAVHDGVATAEQQRMAWHVIVFMICNVEALSFSYAPDGVRAGDFAEGKRWCGRTLQNLARRVLPVNTRGAPPPMPAEQGEPKDPAS